MATVSQDVAGGPQAATTTPRRTTTGRVRYLMPGEKNPIIWVPPEGTGDVRRESAQYDYYEIPVNSIRPVAGKLSLDRDGVVLRRTPTAVGDLYDNEAVTSRYYDEMKAIVQRETGAKRVHIFDHTRRMEGAPGTEIKTERKAVHQVHNDYTEESGRTRIRQLLPDEAEELLQHRFAFINTWRPIVGPVERTPLGFIDPSSLDAEDLVLTEQRYQDRTGYIYQVAYSPKHRWLYVPDMERDELLIFKSLESDTSKGPRFVPHSGFLDAATETDAAPRESIEVRAIAFF